MNGTVWSLAVFDDGSGPALYAGGSFSTAGGVSSRGIAKWDGSTWSAVGPATDGGVYALTVFDDGSGAALYVGGSFYNVGLVGAWSIAKWDGSTWAALGTGMRYISPDRPEVHALGVFDDGSGPALVAAGLFITAGGVSADNIAKWDGSTWSPLGAGIPGSVSAPVHALGAFDDGSGPALYVGGRFDSAGGVSSRGIAKWNGSSWFGLGTGLNSYILDVIAFDDGGGQALYAGGTFTIAGDVNTRGIAKRNGSSWSALGTGLDGSASAFAVFDDGSGPALFVGGQFTSAGGISANRIAKWNGSSWSSLGTGMNGSVSTLTVFDDGSGPALYAGGGFTSAGGVSANYVAKWDGSAWSALGTELNSGVAALAVFDDGSGPGLYAAGGFATPGVAKWDGATWSALGTGMSGGGVNGTWVIALAVFDDGDGPALYAGGSFANAGGVVALHISKWDGSTWSPVGTGMNNAVYTLTVFDDGCGPALYAGGEFITAGGISANNIARWDGSTWSPLGAGVSVGAPFPTSVVLALSGFDDGSGPVLHVGGNFAIAGDDVSLSLGRWACLDPAPLSPPLEMTTYPHGAAKQRYISFQPDVGPRCFAYQVTDVESGSAYYISTPRTTPPSVGGQGLTFVVSDPSPVLFDWTALPVVHVGGCMIAPGDADSATGRAYEVRATADGVDFSAPLTVYTAARPTAANARFWADVVGGFSAGGDGMTIPPTPANSWTPPNRAVSGFDISATLQGASSASTAPHFTWTDVNPEPTDRVTIGPDVLRVVNAFSVGSGKEFYPYAYPETPTTIHAPTPPSPALCPAPPLMATLTP